MNKISSKKANKNYNIAVITTNWNEIITGKLLSGCLEALAKHGIADENITVVTVDGAYEIALTCNTLAKSNRFDGIVALGCVIRGETPHFDFVAGDCSRGITDTMLETGVPIGFGLLTTDTTEQAFARAGGNKGNKGYESAETTLNMITILEQIKG
ncbi:MAG: 6,7-dimethyl-8-ribityllumazine synthase [Candidatus Kapaibacterium sp.]|nr:6,7-dimethyl-8-ribityllumazine synthase [Ignavibacteriota bacterium]MCB9221807.1 6,7-dimethyl-8-ribityllumazine synthase [Ignavibacteria bacterium]